MLTEEQKNELREHLDRSQNPVFYYDNDADGLCSFLILRRALGKGRGIAVRSYPELNVQYARKAKELQADAIFILDKPLISKEFVSEIQSMHLPIIWIDHHDMENEFQNLQDFYIYNPAKNVGSYKSTEPVTYTIYKLVGRKEDVWIAVIGCIADHYMPDFADEFAKNYPEYWGKNAREPFDVYYKTEIGKIATAFNFGLKDSVSHVVQFQNFLILAKGPEDVFSESSYNYSFRTKYKEVKRKYDSLLEKAKTTLSGNLLFFEYGGDLSISGDLANELSYIYKNKYIGVAYIKGGITNISLRGGNVKDILDRILKNIEYSSGGGHRDAVGARIKTEDLTRFRQLLEQEVKSR